jgi:hypothetical protein
MEEGELCGLVEVGGAGLLSLPPASVNISARLVNFTAEVRVSHSYVNRTGCLNLTTCCLISKWLRLSLSKVKCPVRHLSSVAVAI